MPQWGRACVGADGGALMTLTKSAAVLQWGRAWVGADGTSSFWLAVAIASLQWGRAWVGADGPRFLSACCKTQWPCIREGCEQRVGGACLAIAPYAYNYLLAKELERLRWTAHHGAA